ncbi:dihydroneopterin aldolase [Nitrincola alkalisediminis]|uniref:dihydroneopterin aldolase n=1 Tax=Nitrincola alkalisediminis TaxID=1366656 RepID=UPI0018765EE9|nr:dihydroneopterin aldolase [Nitrincola alkalisediminis]
MDIVYIRELQVETIIGIYDWEREVRQIVSLDLEMGTDIRAAANTEDIENTLNYKSVSDRLIAFVGESQFLLVETMAEEIAALIMQEFSVPWLRLRVGKPGAVPQASDVGVIIERGVKS